MKAQNDSSQPLLDLLAKQINNQNQMMLKLMEQNNLLLQQNNQLIQINNEQNAQIQVLIEDAESEEGAPYQTRNLDDG